MLSHHNTRRNKPPRNAEAASRTNPIPTAENSRNNSGPNIEKFDEYYDDSSDEECVESEIKSYNIEHNWKQAQERNRLNSRNSLANDDLLSFVAHVAANKFLHSNAINKIYYPLKRKLLGVQANSETASRQLQRRAREAIVQSLDETCADVSRFLKITGQKKYSDNAIREICAGVRAKFEGMLDAMIAAKIGVFINWLKVDKLCFYERKVLKEKTLLDIEAFEQELNSALLAIFISSISAEQQGANRKSVKQELANLLQNTLDDLAREYRFSEKMHSKGKEEVLQLLSTYKGEYPELVKKVRSMLEMSPANGKVLTMFKNKQAERGQMEELSQAFINDLVKLKETNQKISAAGESLFKKYFTFSSDSLNDEISGSFGIFLRNNLSNALKSFHRPTLDDNYQFVSTNPYTFYANLRLSNRSQKREILNKKYAFFKNHSAARVWKLADHHRSAVVETQELSNGTLGRRDYVQGLGTYDKIYGDICEVKNDLRAKRLSIDDRIISEWIRAAFRGTSDRIRYSILSDAVKRSMEEMIDRIAYLMHGCEAARNIAMIVLVPMLEDLLTEGNEWTLQEAFTGAADKDTNTSVRLMPMAPEGAVAAARTLERAYREYTPHHYLYAGVEDRDGSDNKMSKDELVRFEARVVRAWINLKCGKAAKAPATHLAQWLLEQIESHFGRWFATTDINVCKDDKHGNSTRKHK